MKLCAVVAIVAIVAIVGCEKGNRNEPAKSSRPVTREVKLSSDEAAMLAHLPAGNVALFGGNYMRFQKYLNDSPMSRLMSAMTQSAGTGMTEWMNCFVETKNVQMLGAVKLDAGHVDMRFVMTGMELSQLETCAKRASFPAKMDADQKFIGLEFPNPLGPMKSGYLVVAPGMLYTRVSMQFPVTTAIAIDRAALEADVASIAAKGDAATEKALVSQIADVDRSKAVWIVANAAGTPIADKVGTAHATLDIDNGIAMDVTVQVLDKAVADRVADTITKAKQQAGSIGGTIQTVIEKMRFDRDGDHLRVQLAVDNAQLNAMVDQLAPFMPPPAAGR